MGLPRRLGVRVLVLVTAALTLSVAACGEEDDGSVPPDAAEPPSAGAAITTIVDTVEPASLVLVFDGEDCTYDGPVELGVGPVEFVFVNESDAAASANMVSINEGYTVQDVVDDLGPEPSYGHHPPWTREVGGVWSTTQPAESHQWDWEIEAGLYAMVCVRISPPGVWFGSGLTVVD